MRIINKLFGKLTLVLFVVNLIAITNLNARTNSLVIAGSNAKLSAGGGQGYYVEYRLASKGVTGTSKSYSLDGNYRAETEMVLTAMQGKKINTVTIVKKDNPDIVYTLNETDKTYTETTVNKNAVAKSKPEQDYEITVIGKEKVNDYNCTHVSILYKSTNKTMEMWTSPDVPNYAYLKEVKNRYIEGSKFFKALEAKGAAGFPVRMLSASSKEGHFQMDLIKAEKRAIDGSLFSLDGYKKTESINNGMNNTGKGMDKEQMDKIKNMTPDERLKYIQDMQKKQ